MLDGLQRLCSHILFVFLWLGTLLVVVQDATALVAAGGEKDEDVDAGGGKRAKKQVICNLCFVNPLVVVQDAPVLVAAGGNKDEDVSSGGGKGGNRGKNKIEQVVVIFVL